MRPSDQRNVPHHAQESEIRQQAIAWVVRLRNDRVQQEDRKLFDVWLAQSATHARIFEKVSAVWDDPELHAAAIRVSHTSPLDTAQRQQTAPRRGLRQAATLAACVVILVMAATHFDVMTWLRADYQTVAGERRTIHLPDQSTVTLNTQTAIAMSFDGTVRRVRLLKGEAFFKVQSDPERPFVVESQDTTTRAVGTEFVVRAQPGHDQVTVLEGIVDVSSRREDRSTARLAAGSRIQTDQGRLGQAYSVDLTTASAWLRGRLVVNGVPLAQVIDEVRRYYPGTIVLWNHDIGAVQVTGTYNLEDPTKILSLLVKTFPLHMIGMADRLAILF